MQILTVFMASDADIENARRTVSLFPTLSQVLEQAMEDAVAPLGG